MLRTAFQLYYLYCLNESIYGNKGESALLLGLRCCLVGVPLNSNEPDFSSSPILYSFTLMTSPSSLPSAFHPGPFGHKQRKNFFFPPGKTEFNHGSYGKIEHLFSRAHSVHFFILHLTRRVRVHVYNLCVHIDRYLHPVRPAEYVEVAQPGGGESRYGAACDA